MNHLDTITTRQSSIDSMATTFSCPTLSDVGSIAERRSKQFEEWTGLESQKNKNEILELEWNDFKMMKQLGKGTFSCVHEIKYKGNRWALKQLDLTSSSSCGGNQAKWHKHWKRGAIDLVLEFQLISHLNHPNIIQLHAVKAGSIRESINSRSYFLILDHLVDTLENKLIQWQKQQQQEQQQMTLCGGYITKFWKQHNQDTTTSSSFNNNNDLNQMMKRVQTVALGIASGMQHLHHCGVIFRDLKPQNIGFTKDGTVKIFDFGVSRDLHYVRRAGDKLGFTGTPRYMANEVGNSKMSHINYGLEADVYSFGIVLWELLTLKQPFCDMKTIDDYKQSVIVHGQRPDINLIPHTSLQRLVQQCWHSDPKERPTFDEIYPQLKQIIQTHAEHNIESTTAMTNKNNKVLMNKDKRRGWLRSKRKSQRDVKKTTTTTTTPKITVQHASSMTRQSSGRFE